MEDNVEAARAPHEISVFVSRIVLTVLNNLPSGSSLNSTAAINEPYVKNDSAQKGHDAIVCTRYYIRHEKKSLNNRRWRLHTRQDTAATRHDIFLNAPKSLYYRPRVRASV